MNVRMGKPTLDYYKCDVGIGILKSRSGFGFIVIDIRVFNPEYIGVKSERGELKHLSTRRKGNQPILR